MIRGGETVMTPTNSHMRFGLAKFILWTMATGVAVAVLVGWLMGTSATNEYAIEDDLSIRVSSRESALGNKERFLIETLRNREVISTSGNFALAKCPPFELVNFYSDRNIAEFSSHRYRIFVHVMSGEFSVFFHFDPRMEKKNRDGVIKSDGKTWQFWDSVDGRGTSLWSELVFGFQRMVVSLNFHFEKRPGPRQAMLPRPKYRFTKTYSTHYI